MLGMCFPLFGSSDMIMLIKTSISLLCQWLLKEDKIGTDSAHHNGVDDSDKRDPGTLFSLTFTGRVLR